jgi:hypothetical protein
MERWCMLSLFSGYGFLMGASWTVFSSIPDEAADFYGVGEVAVSMFELVFMIGYILTFIPASWLLARSLQRTLQGTVLLMGLGAAIRLAAWDNYTFALIGQSLIALGNAVALSASAALPEFWFPLHQTLLATAVAGLSSGLGSGLQLILSSLLSDVPLLLEIQAALCLIEVIAMSVLFKPDPMHRESSVACRDLRQYSKNGKAMTFLLLSGATAGTVFAFIGLLYVVLEPLGYSSLQSGFIGLTLNLAGMFGGVCSTLISASNRFSTKTLQIYLLCGITASIILCFAVLYFPTMIVASALYGFSALGFIPQAIRAAVEDAPTVHPSVPAVVFYLISQVMGLILSGLALLFQSSTSLSALYLFAIFTTLTMGCFLALYRMDLPADTEAQPLKEDESSLGKDN